MGVEYGATDMTVETDGQEHGEHARAARDDWAARHEYSEWPGASTWGDGDEDTGTPEAAVNDGGGHRRSDTRATMSESVAAAMAACEQDGNRNRKNLDAKNGTCLSQNGYGVWKSW